MWFRSDLCSWKPKSTRLHVCRTSNLETRISDSRGLGKSATVRVLEHILGRWCICHGNDLFARSLPLPCAILSEWLPWRHVLKGLDTVVAELSQSQSWARLTLAPVAEFRLQIIIYAILVLPKRRYGRRFQQSTGSTNRDDGSKQFPVRTKLRQLWGDRLFHFTKW